MAISSIVAALPADLRRRVTERSLAAGDRLFRRGDPVLSMFYVLDGEIRLARYAPGGGEAVLQRARQGFVAEASLDQTAYHCDAVASVDARVSAIPVEAMRAALADPGVRRIWLRHLNRELRRARASCERLMLRSAADRITHYIETEGEDGAIALTRSKKEWAAELGLTHEALYRALSRMAAAGRIETAGPRIALRRQKS